MVKLGVFLVLFLIAGRAFSAKAFDLSRTSLSRNNVEMQPATTWLDQESQIARTLLLKNISPAGTRKGVVIASPQKDSPNYFRHWTRDAALTMEVIFQMLNRAQDPLDQKGYSDLLTTYTFFSRQNQLSANLGEPIFEADGNPFLGPWNRPQNDGPALRAIVLTEWAMMLLDQGKTEFVRNNLYEGILPASTVIKADLEYVSSHWADPSFDLWEEVKATHFYTRMVERKALLLGAKLARRMNDPGAAEWYELQASSLENALTEHVVVADHSWIGASLHYVDGWNTKHSNLDIAVILGVLHGGYDRFFAASAEAVQNTFVKLNAAFAAIYPINRDTKAGGVALGRYPEDVYAGTDFNGGNPWVLSTLAGAEYCYRVAQEVASVNIAAADQWMAAGDQYVQRVQYHANPDGSLAEQIDRNSGYMWSARDLTWSYAAIMTATWARQQSAKTMIDFKSKTNLLKQVKQGNK